MSNYYNLGSHNLFACHFIPNSKETTKENTLTETNEIRVISKWMRYKSSDIFMSSYRPERTQYIQFLTLIPLDTLVSIFEDLKSTYLANFPFSEKNDFIYSVFDTTIGQLEEFVKSDHIIFGGVFKEESFDFYYSFNFEFPEDGFKDYIIQSDKPIEYYKQYYKQVLRLIEEIEYPSINSKPSRKRISKSKEVADILKGGAISIQKPSKKELGLAELITHQKSQALANQISIRYKNIKGKQLKLLLISLKELGLFPNERMDRKFHTACKDFFDWDIGSYEAMRRYKYNENVDKEECELMKDFLTNIINGNGNK
ncbi:MAG: hypothetical protein MK105_05860 [Crocinitomicaceae bacterium]|nr:hypothetical protein [Crocinitomicaceae bacterium]